MADLNGGPSASSRALEAGQHALTCFAPAEINSAVAMANIEIDGCVFEMEHNPWDGRLPVDSPTPYTNRAQIAKAAAVVLRRCRRWCGFR